MIKSLIDFAGAIAYMAGICIVLVAVFTFLHGLSRNDSYVAGAKAVVMLILGIWLMHLHDSSPF